MKQSGARVKYSKKNNFDRLNDYTILYENKLQGHIRVITVPCNDLTCVVVAYPEYTPAGL